MHPPSCDDCLNIHFITASGSESLNAVVINGSGNPDGFTEEMCSVASDVLSGRGSDVTRIRLTEFDIGHCTGCGACRDGGCPMEDDMPHILEIVGGSDIMVLATPLRFSGPSSVVKTMMDRCQPFWFRKDIPHPSKLLPMVCAGSDNPDFGPVTKIFRHFSITMGMECLPVVTVTGTDSMPRGAVLRSPDFRSALETSLGGRA